MKNQNLVTYYNELLKAQNDQNDQKEKQGTPYIGRIDNPEGTCKTLWVPVYSGNRTASIDLNHELIGFDDNGVLWGANANCGTLYVIIEVPDTFDDQQLETLSEIVCNKLGKDENYPKQRVLKADDRLPLILESIESLKLT